MIFCLLYTISGLKVAWLQPVTITYLSTYAKYAEVLFVLVPVEILAIVSELHRE
jgi:hypothetical protein